MFYFKFVVKSILKWIAFFILAFLALILLFFKMLWDFLKRLWNWLLGKCPKCKLKKSQCECEGCPKCKKDHGECKCTSQGSKEERMMKEAMQEAKDELEAADHDFSIPSPYNFTVKKNDIGILTATSEETDEVWQKLHGNWIIKNPEIWKEKKSEEN